MTVLLVAGAFALAFIPLAIIVGHELRRRTPPRVPPAHPRRDTINALRQTGEQVDRTVFPDPPRQ